MREEIQVTHRFPVSPDRVFDAWLDPAMIGKWMFGPAVREEEELVRLDVEARVGGNFLFLVRRQGEDVEHVGEYLEVLRPSRLAFTWGVPKYASEMSRVQIDIVPIGNGCELTLTHELLPEWANRTKEGWTMLLGSLEKALS